VTDGQRQHTPRADLGTVLGSAVEIAFERSGDPDGWPVVLLHGFPYDVRGYDDVVGRLTSAGADVVVPYLRGFGPTRYRDETVPRSGQQAALGSDLRELIDALELARPIVAGFDWGGRAACVASALWPHLVGGLVTSGGYNVHDIAAMGVTPDLPGRESRMWYQLYLHSDRGRAGLERYREDLARQLWGEWSPGWDVPDGAFDTTAPSFANPDFVATVVHSYRHRYGLAAGDPAYEDAERSLASRPQITVPTVVVDPTADPLQDARPPAVHAERFPQLVEHRPVATGHNAPQEDPASFASAIIVLHDGLSVSSLD
jgi:pimeloyl-ACP methyl ester carboxylesterase